MFFLRAISTLLLGTSLFTAAQSVPRPVEFPGAGSLLRAEKALRAGEILLAESEYRSAAESALLALANLAMNSRNWTVAVDAFEEASTAVSDPSQALQGVAMAYLQQGKYPQAEGVVREVLREPTRDPARLKQLLASAYAGQQRFAEALEQMKELRAAFPSQPELAYTQASIALKAKKLDVAAKAFRDLKQLRPGAPVHVLAGRTYRDYGFYAEAEAELREALRLDPRIRRANYYLALTYLLRDRTEGLDQAIPALRREIAIAPGDYLANLNLGIALLAARHPAEAIDPLIKASSTGELEPLYHLGQAQFQTGAYIPAVDSLQRYLAKIPNDPTSLSTLSSCHYVLGQALRALGKSEEAGVHFEQSKKLKQELASKFRDRLKEYMGGETNVQDPPVDPSTFSESEAAVSSAEAERLRQQLSNIIARAYFNLGVILSQRKQYRSAAAVFHRAAKWQPDFPNVDYSLGVARFQAGQHQLAIEPLRKAYESTGSPDARRLLGLSYFQTESFLRAAELLSADPGLDSDASLQYTLAVALVRSGQAQRAGSLFGRMLQQHGDSAELHVLLGDAYAQQESFDEALASYEKALQLDAKTANAHLSRGLIFLRRGALDDSERELRAELKNHPKDVRAQFHAAYVLEAKGKADEATAILRMLLKSAPSHTDARYLLGKILLDRNDVNAALEQLEAAVRLSPNESRYRYQLGLALQKLGRESDAEKQFASFRELKRKETVQ